jgi:hypothetical protein
MLYTHLAPFVLRRARKVEVLTKILWASNMPSNTFSSNCYSGEIGDGYEKRTGKEVNEHMLFLPFSTITALAICASSSTILENLLQISHGDKDASLYCNKYDVYLAIVPAKAL